LASPSVNHQNQRPCNAKSLGSNPGLLDFSKHISSGN